MKHEHGDKVNARRRALFESRLHDPFSVLGRHREGDEHSNYDAQQAVLRFERRARDGTCMVVAVNFTPTPRFEYMAKDLRAIRDSSAAAIAATADGSKRSIGHGWAQLLGFDHAQTIGGNDPACGCAFCTA